MMDEDKFMDWYQYNFDSNAQLFAEKNEEEFEDWCFQRYIQAGVDNYDEDR